MHRQATALDGIRLCSVFSGNGIGTGTLYIESASSVAWKPPGGTKGAAVTLVDGEVALVQGVKAGADEPWALVARTTGEDLVVGSSPVFCDGEECALEELQAIDAAVRAAEQAQSSGIGDERIQRADLARLRRDQVGIRARYEREVGLLPRGPVYFDVSGS